MIVTVPALKIMNVFPDSLAMDGSELTYENAPGLLVTGCGMVPVPPGEYVCGAILKSMLGDPLLIFKFVDIVPSR